MNKQPLEVQLIAWELIKWHAERQMKAVQAKIDRRIKQFKEYKGKLPKSQIPMDSG